MPIRPLIIVAAVVIAVVVLAWAGFAVAGSQNGDAGAQPIAFSHTFHTSDLGLQCTFCHRNVTKTVEAGLPPVELCMFCHTVAGAGNPEVEKVRSAFAEQRPINWNRVYRVPDIVRFTHEPHIRAQLDCSNCHGDLTRMTTARAAGPLGMAQCLTCHRQKGASADCSTCHY